MTRTLVLTFAVTMVTHQTLLAVPVTYTDEATYLADLAALGEPVAFEGFEGSDWDSTRSPASAAAVVSQGVSWSAGDALSTSGGWARTGDWGLFDNPGGPDVITMSASELMGVGGWFRRSTAFAIQILLDGVPVGGFAPTPAHSFFGVIDTDGFSIGHFRCVQCRHRALGHG